MSSAISTVCPCQTTQRLVHQACDLHFTRRRTRSNYMPTRWSEKSATSWQACHICILQILLHNYATCDTCQTDTASLFDRWNATATYRTTLYMSRRLDQNVQYCTTTPRAHTSLVRRRYELIPYCKLHVSGTEVVPCLQLSLNNANTTVIQLYLRQHKLTRRHPHFNFQSQRSRSQCHTDALQPTRTYYRVQLHLNLTDSFQLIGIFLIVK